MPLTAPRTLNQFRSDAPGRAPGAADRQAFIERQRAAGRMPKPEPVADESSLASAFLTKALPRALGIDGTVALGDGRLVRIRQVLNRDLKRLAGQAEVKDVLIATALSGKLDAEALGARIAGIASGLLDFLLSLTEDCDTGQALTPEQFDEMTVEDGQLLLRAVTEAVDFVGILKGYQAVFSNLARGRAAASPPPAS